MMLNHEGKGESEDNDRNDEDVFEYLGYDVVEHDAKLSVWYPMNFENPTDFGLYNHEKRYWIHLPCNETQSPC